jgi:hypothetical protein
MAKRKKAAAATAATAAQAKARGAADAARPYVQRLIEDDDLRDDLKDAYESARDAYDRALDGKGPSKLLDDKKLQGNLRDAADSLQSVAEALREPEKRKKRLGFGRLLLVAVVAAVLAIALSEDLRKALLDRLFGAEEEFEYTSTTTAATPPTPTT